MKAVEKIAASITTLSKLTVEERVEAYNALQQSLGKLVADVAPDPACSPQLVAVGRVDGNDYNPNAVAKPEMRLLRESIEADGITMAVVVMRVALDRVVVIDGFHRSATAKEIGRRYVPCSVIERDLADRMASTVRHNRARGKHQVGLMAALVKAMEHEGWESGRVAAALGMSPEELLRLRQMVGAARVMAADEFSQSWGFAKATGEEP